jgi:hypothetical protein
MNNKDFIKQTGLRTNTVFVFIASFLVYFFPILSQEDNIKKEIHIPFPENITIEEAIQLDKKKATKVIPPAKNSVKKNISIPFPNDPEAKNTPEIEHKKNCLF